jgi:hypothetical protein
LSNSSGADPPQPEAEIFVVVRRQWNATKIARVRFADLRGFHWSQYGAGHKFRFGGIAPRPFLHAFTLCTQIEGEIGHSCQHGPPPHKIKVCITRKDNRRAFPFLESLAHPTRSVQSVYRKHKKKIAQRLAQWGPDKVSR